jgi:SAM-dependent methyltransferase
MGKKITYDETKAKNYNTWFKSKYQDLQILKIYSYLHLSDKSFVIDAGCGSGRVLQPLSKLIPVLGIEPSKAMFKQLPVGSGAFNMTFQDYLYGDKVKPNCGGIYFSFSLHLMGTPDEQIQILIDCFERLLEPNSRILVITMLRDQLEESIFNKSFPTLDYIDTHRYLSEGDFRLNFEVDSIEKFVVYEKQNKENLFKKIRSRYISSLQLLSKKEVETGIRLLDNSTKSSFIEVPDFYSYVTLTDTKD